MPRWQTCTGFLGFGITIVAFALDKLNLEISKGLLWGLVYLGILLIVIGVSPYLYYLFGFIRKVRVRSPFFISGSELNVETNEDANIDFSDAGQLTAQSLNNHTFRLSTLVAETHNPIKGRTFNNCVMYGPSVVFFKNCAFFGEQKFDVPKKNMINAIIDLSSTRTIDYAVVFIDCTFRDCSFSRIGVLGTMASVQATLGRWTNPDS